MQLYVLGFYDHLLAETVSCCVIFFASFFVLLCSYLFNYQEFRGVAGLTDAADLESDMSKVPARTVEILASCHALVFVDNKLVC